MIVARAPVRFSLGGGGTDLPAYASRFGGYCIAGAINRYVYVVANPRFGGGFRICYRDTEIVDTLDEIRHPLFRECLRLAEVDGIELASMADVPANSGLGSSGSFAVACLAALHARRGRIASWEEVAAEACTVEIERLGEPIGKQDQYVAARGGICEMHLGLDGSVLVHQLRLAPETVARLEANLRVFYCGTPRLASAILGAQKTAIDENADVDRRMHVIKAMGHLTREILLSGDLDQYGELLDQHWQLKRGLVEGITTDAIDDHYRAARAAGAIGGKLMGAGGGGFFLFYARPADQRRLYETMAERGLPALPWRFEPEGVRCDVLR